MVTTSETDIRQEVSDWSVFATDIPMTTATIIKMPTLNEDHVSEIIACEGIIRAKKRKLLEKVVLD